MKMPKLVETVLPNGVIEVRNGNCAYRKLSAEAMAAATAPAFANQQQVLDTILDAVANLIAAGTTVCPPNYSIPGGLGPVPLDPSKIIEWMGDSLERTNVQGDQVIVYGFEDWKPNLYSGAGRLASLGELTIFVSVWTRYAMDISGSNNLLFRAQSRGHWLRVFQVENAFSDQNLNTEYDENLTPIGIDLSVRPMMQIDSKFSRSKPKDLEWKISIMYFAVPLDKPILQPPAH